MLLREAVGNSLLFRVDHMKGSAFYLECLIVIDDRLARASNITCLDNKQCLLMFGQKKKTVGRA